MRTKMYIQTYLVKDTQQNLNLLERLKHEVHLRSTTILGVSLQIKLI